MPATSTPTFNSEKTEVLNGFEKTTETIMKFLNTAEMSMNICADYTWPSVAMGVEVFRKGAVRTKSKKRPVTIYNRHYERQYWIL